MMFNSYMTNTLKLDAMKCNGCGRCVELCPHEVFRVTARRAELAHPLACMECGACELNCTEGAISVESGVGCAAAMMMAALRGRKEGSCG